MKIDTEIPTSAPGMEINLVPGHVSAIRRPERLPRPITTMLESLKKICGCGVGCSRCWSVCVTIIFVTGHRSTMCSGPPTDMAMMFADIMGQVTDRKKA